MGKRRDHVAHIRVFGHGRFVFARDLKYFVLANFLIYVATALFFVSSVPYVWRHISPALPVVISYVLLLSLAHFYRTAFTDPGIMPRAPQPQADTSMAPMTQELVVGGETVRVKWCDTCNMYRRPRATHCSSCNVCVEYFDHHCPWVGNCVGRRNYRHFFMFIACLAVYIALVLATVVYKIVHKGKADNQSAKELFRQQWPDFVVAVIGFFTLWPVAGLTYFHTRLICSNRTTNEAITGKVRRSRNPYDKGVVKNIEERLCGPRAPSFLVPREIMRSHKDAIGPRLVNPFKDSPEIALTVC